MTPDSNDDSQDWLLDDEPAAAEAEAPPPPLRPWKVLVVDDERDVHSATRLAIKNVQYKDRPLLLLSAYSGHEAEQVMRQHADVALILLDVVMESDDAGLRLVQRIRGQLGNHLTRIVLRTGQPGQAPEQQVVLEYDINDYKTKTELTVQKLFTTVIASLRAYDSLLALEKHRQGLSKILEGASTLYQLHSLQEFASGVLKQISAILDVGPDGVLYIARDIGAGQPPQPEVLAATGSFESLLGQPGNAIQAQFPQLHAAMHEALHSRQNVYRPPIGMLYIATQNRHQFVLHFSPPWPLEEMERSLLQVFCQRIAAAYDNLYLYNQLMSAQRATVVALADLAEFRDSDTGSHVLRVQQLTDAIAQQLRRMGAYPQDLSANVLDMIGLASILHDVGKVGTPDHILHKPGRLDPEERQIMEQHATIGASILGKAGKMVEGVSYLSLGAQIAGGHHEHYDGNGYPAGLKGDDIPLAARIAAVVDVFDALLHKRPYKEPWPLPEVMEYIAQRSGSQFDPLVVLALQRLVSEGQLAANLLGPLHGVLPVANGI